VNRHLPGAGTIDVHTVEFDLVQAQLPDVVKDGLTAAITGATGTGKTFAARCFAESLTRSGTPWSWLQFSPDASTAKKEVPVRMLIGLSGGRARDVTGEQYLLTDDLLELLTGSGRALFLDEAHNLGTAGLQRIRSLWDQSDYGFSLIEVGSGLLPLLGQKGSAEVTNRFDVHRHFEPLAGAELLSALRSYHPLYAHCPSALLRRLNDEYAHGLWRHWARVTRHAVKLAPLLKVSALTAELVDSTLLDLPRISTTKASAT
jgi:Rad3-related DNA helicase